VGSAASLMNPGCPRLGTSRHLATRSQCCEHRFDAGVILLSFPGARPSWLRCADPDAAPVTVVSSYGWRLRFGALFIAIWKQGSERRCRARDKRIGVPVGC